MTMTKRLVEWGQRQRKLVEEERERGDGPDPKAWAVFAEETEDILFALSECAAAGGGDPFANLFRLFLVELMSDRDPLPDEALAPEGEWWNCTNESMLSTLLGWVDSWKDIDPEFDWWHGTVEEPEVLKKARRNE